MSLITLKKMLFQSLAIVSLAALAASNEINFTDCGNHEFRKVSIDGCSGSTCSLPRGRRMHIEGTFIANQDSAKITIDPSVIVSGHQIRPPGPFDNDICKHTDCPIKKGQTVSFIYEMNLSREMPSLMGTLQANFIGDDGKLGCVSVSGGIN